MCQDLKIQAQKKKSVQSKSTSFRKYFSENQKKKNPQFFHPLIHILLILSLSDLQTLKLT